MIASRQHLARSARSSRSRALALAAVALSSVGCGDLPEGAVTVTTVPTPPEYVSGGQALVRIDAVAEVDLSEVAVSVDGRAADIVAPPPPDGLGRAEHALLALVSGLRLGDNVVEVAVDGRVAASLSVTNWPIEGPIFSGAHLEPYFCLGERAPQNGRPARFAIGNGDFLDGSGFGEHCSMPTRYDFVYRTAGEGGEGGQWRPLESAALPADAATVTTSEGRSVPFVVRIETGTINRAIYQIAVLHAPSTGSDAEVSPWSPPPAWNGRLVYTYGGGCEAGFFQGTSTGGVLRADVLAAGYAVASSTLNVNAQGGCNDPLSAETTLMVKERFAEGYGVPLHTIGNGGSGGAMQQLLIAGAYPGILNGILPTLTFPDAVTYFIDTEECRLPLRRYLNASDLDEETKRVIGGWARWYTCDESLGPRTNRIGPDDCPSAIPESERYDAGANPTGVRCSIYDAMHSVFGKKRYEEIAPAPAVDFGRSPHDNVGVQYGLLALNSGKISKEVFLDLNEGVGGWDIDFLWRPERAEGDPAAARAAYETGRVTSGAGGLAVTPIIDERSYLDDSGNFHTSYYSFVMRERLRRDNGHSNNYVLQRHGSGMSLAMENLAAMDEWLTSLALDDSGEPLAEKVVRARPRELVESCWDAEGKQIVEPQRYDVGRLYDNVEGQCNALYPPHTGPHMIAGGPLTNDVLKCQLEPLDPSDYRVVFTEAEWARLQRIFPTGVCDWSRPGVGQGVTPRTWLSFGPSPVNRYQPPA
ncbi:MAG TPA: DUF6351 family protein [Longimicrobiales bacterium]|nr:DUF6351 family protein [Longimicrobiales bacterium]